MALERNQAGSGSGCTPFCEEPAVTSGWLFFMSARSSWTDLNGITLSRCGLDSSAGSTAFPTPCTKTTGLRFWLASRCRRGLLLRVFAVVALNDEALDLASKRARDLVRGQVTAFDCRTHGHHHQRPRRGLRVGLDRDPALVDIGLA